MPIPCSQKRVVTLAYQGLSTFEFGVAIEVFGLPRPEFSEWYHFGVCALERGPLRATGGISIAGARGLGLLRRADTIVVPGWRGVHEPVPKPLLRAIQGAYRRGARVLSFCSGAFVLAAAGLLDGRRAATHWRYAEALQAAYPEVRVDASVLYVDEGRVLTSAGSAAAIDLSLYVVRKDFGPAIANQVARRLVVSPHRDGGQSQFIKTVIERESHPQPLLELMHWAREHLTRDLSVKTLAKQAGMSERSLARHFKDRLGVSPYAWLTRERVLAAQSLLEGSPLSMDQLAQACGFGSTPTLRHHFKRVVGLSPKAYRSRFSRH